MAGRQKQDRSGQASPMYLPSEKKRLFSAPCSELCGRSAGLYPVPEAWTKQSHTCVLMFPRSWIEGVLDHIKDTG